MCIANVSSVNYALLNQTVTYMYLVNTGKCTNIVNHYFRTS